ncbi:response regulator [Pyxidicoccus sp. MSG2]|uniref:response regulator n=1 Tax=Pyxidicoccus sp. MSG2 TaxID=2996790 RepID=UPI00226F3088|nr:response regulator [Pyxidicoccus sp. MSG2]MCY1017870.1 response regulator [Pyxidicoccus sp. MSG2]
MVDPKLATVLNVNDDDANRYLVNRILEMAGFKVLEAATGMAALLMAEQHRPDVIVLDVKLPDISGYEVCERLRANPGTAAMAVLHTSATFVTSDKKVRALDGGADAYLTQPFEASELIATVKSLLRLRHAEQAARLRAEELAEMDRRKDEFLAMLAHELRNPLAAIMTAIGILERKPADDPKESRMRGIIQRQTHHLARLVDDLLDVSRITRDRVELRLSRVDLLAVLQQVLQVARPMAESRGLGVEVSLPREPLWVHADATRLEQVFTNLLDNASKYTDGGHISLRVEHEGVDGSAKAVVRVKDTGIGIPADVLPYIFDLFAQADTSLERSRGGLGIGLTLVRKLVRMHGGEVHAFSDGPGRGSEFVVKLPLLHEVAVPADSGKGTDTRRNGRRILLVEDNSDARQAMRDLLELWGHQVAVAPDGLQGLALALTQSPELALVDIGLPGMDGYRVAEELRSRVGQRIRLVAITGYGGPEGHDRALRAGFDRHLVKPVKPDELDRLISTL